MDHRSHRVVADIGDLLHAEAWEGCHEAYRAYSEASRIHSRCLRAALEGDAVAGSAGAAEAGALARELLIEWLAKCEAVSEQLAWQSVGHDDAHDESARISA